MQPNKNGIKGIIPCSHQKDPNSIEKISTILGKRPKTFHPETTKNSSTFPLDKTDLLNITYFKKPKAKKISLCSQEAIAQLQVCAAYKAKWAVNLPDKCQNWVRE